MPIIAPIAAFVAGAVGAVALTRRVLREVSRINAELEAMREARMAEMTRAKAPRKLKRDTATGVWRPQD